MKDQLAIRDIKNTRRLHQGVSEGKHRRNNLVKWVCSIAEVGAHIVSAYGAHKWGPSIVSKFTGWKASEAVKDVGAKAAGQKVAEINLKT